MIDYVKEENERIARARANAETAHDFHKIEFQGICA